MPDRNAISWLVSTGVWSRPEHGSRVCSEQESNDGAGQRRCAAISIRTRVRSSDAGGIVADGRDMDAGTHSL
jgi:hypothetical protein